MANFILQKIFLYSRKNNENKGSNERPIEITLESNEQVLNETINSGNSLINDNNLNDINREMNNEIHFCQPIDNNSRDQSMNTINSIQETSVFNPFFDKSLQKSVISYIRRNNSLLNDTLDEHSEQMSDQLVSQDINRNEQNLKAKCDIIHRSNSNKHSLSVNKSIRQRKTQLNSGTDVKRNRYKNVKYSCDWPGCDYMAWSSSRVEEHKIIRHHPDDGTKLRFTCDHPGCGKKFKVKKQLSRHLKSHSTEERVQCQHCGKDYKDSTGLKSHVLHQHIKERSFVCDQSGCQYSTTTASKLKYHKVRCHSDRSIVCTVEGCDKLFKSRSNLKDHIITHNTQCNYKCQFDGCDKTFKTAKSSRIHYQQQHADNEPFRCDWPGCEFETKFRKSYLGHRDVHKSERDFLCEWPECGKGFKNKKQLELHTRRHTNDKRYVCLWPGCQYSTTDSGNFVKHRKQVHEKSINYNRNKK